MGSLQKRLICIHSFDIVKETLINISNFEMKLEAKIDVHGAEIPKWKSHRFQIM